MDTRAVPPLGCCVILGELLKSPRSRLRAWARAMVVVTEER